MIKDSNFETFLRISSNKYSIYLIDKNNLKNLYQNEKRINNENVNFESLIYFLDDNIFKIEKLASKFIKNITVVLETKEIINTFIGVKKKNYDVPINLKYLKKTLSEIKDIFKKNYRDQTIMHMIVDHYLINGKNYKYFEEDFKTKDFCLVVNFKSIPKTFSLQLEKVLENYQIKINKYLDEKYIKNFFIGQEIEFPFMICKILNGSNQNEVQLIPKNDENKGFFEKFFQFFS